MMGLDGCPPNGSDCLEKAGLGRSGRMRKEETYLSFHPHVPARLK